MAGWIFVVFCVTALAVFFSWQRKRPATARKEHTEGVVPPYHGVSVIAEKVGCAGARAIRERRYLAREAPRLPLPDCDAATCHCRYSHFDDRRAGERRKRRAMPREFDADAGRPENRNKRDRRSSRATGFPSDAI